MADHITEEEQIEALKSWWADNGKQTLLGVVLVAGGYFGWQSWTGHAEEQAEAASNAYQEMLDIVVAADETDSLSAGQQTAVNNMADAIKQNYGSSQYAYYAALIKAKIAVQNGDLDTAATELRWALDAAGDKASTAIARLRLARVEAARGNLDIALQMVQGKDAGEMASQYIEAKGDFYLQQGNQAAAFTAYEAAMADIAMQNSTARALLQLKIGQVQPAPEAPAPDTEVDHAVTDQ